MKTTANAIETKAAKLVATATKITDKGLANLYRSDAANLRSVAEYLRKGNADVAIDVAFGLETGCRDHFPEAFWKLGVSRGLVEVRPNGKRAFYVKAAS